MLPVRININLRRWLPLALVLLAALALRVAVWGALPRQGLISDEAEYLAAANWLALGRGFAWHQGWLWTRAPVYPLFLAAHMRLFGFGLTPIYVTQTLLSLFNVVLVYLLARQVLEPDTSAHSTRIISPPILAALLAALYLPFASYAQMILSETLYLTLLLLAFVLLGWWARGQQRNAPLLLALAGLLFGLATLTRGLTLGFLPFVALWLWRAQWATASGPQTLAVSIINRDLSAFVLACTLTILPWSFYASRAYGGLVLVDTTGAFNLLLGARTAYDGQRSDAPARNFVLALLDRQLSQAERRDLLADSCLFRQQDARLLEKLAQPPGEIGQGERQELMMAEGLCLLRAAPGSFLRKSAAELIDLFQINYTGAERMSGGFALGRLPRWYVLALFLLDDTLYVLMLPLAVVGWDRANRRGYARWLTGLIGLWWLYNLLTAPLLFAINRFRIPLLPFACIYAAAALRTPAEQPASRARWSYLVAALLALAALAPYAYLQPAPSAWASYLGPYPSSLDITLKAWEARPTYLHEQQVIAALGRGDAQAARDLLATTRTPDLTLRLVMPLLAGLEGKAVQGLALLPETSAISATKDWQASVVRGDLLRRLEDWDAARAAFTPGYVDDQNPVGWAWQWLHPPPTRRIDLGGNLDLGYIRGFYLGEGDPGAAGTFRWSGPEAALHFPAQSRHTAQQLCLRADGRGWPADLPSPQLTLLLASTKQAADPVVLTSLELERAIQIYCADLPPAAPGEDLVIILRSDTFIPEAADLLAQQGPQAGQLRRLGVRLDWAELVEPQ